jgi:hypothetical protein
VFENRVVRKIFGAASNEVTRNWRRLHNEELYKLCTSPNIIRLIKLRRTRWATLVACVGERVGAYGVVVGKS